MPIRIAATAALTIFAVCLALGMAAGNELTTILGRALVALAATLAIGWIIGTMAQRMLDENLRALAAEEKKSEQSTAAAKSDER